MYQNAEITLLEKLLNLLRLKFEKGVSFEALQLILDDNHNTLPKGNLVPKNVQSLKNEWENIFGLTKVLSFLMCQKGRILL